MVAQAATTRATGTPAAPNITQRMLTKQLRELEASGLVVRTVYAEDVSSIA